MATGTVKWYNPAKRFGFIRPDGSKGADVDVFVHASALEKAGIDTLNDGDHVSYELIESKGKTSAGNLKLID